MIGLGRFSERLSVSRRFPVEADAVVADALDRHISRLPDVGHAEELLQGAFIAVDGARGPVELDFEMFQKPPHQYPDRIG